MIDAASTDKAGSESSSATDTRWSRVRLSARATAARTMPSSRSLRSVGDCDTSRRSADDSPSMNRLSRSDSSSMTSSSSRRPSLDSSDCGVQSLAPMSAVTAALMAVSGRPQVVRQRVEKRGLELFVAPRGFRFAGAIEGRL